MGREALAVLEVMTTEGWSRPIGSAWRLLQYPRVANRPRLVGIRSHAQSARRMAQSRTHASSVTAPISSCEAPSALYTSGSFTRC